MPGSDALTFEDLDDVIANFAEPYLENVRALVSSPACENALDFIPIGAPDLPAMFLTNPCSLPTPCMCYV